MGLIEKIDLALSTPLQQQKLSSAIQMGGSFLQDPMAAVKHIYQPPLLARAFVPGK
jgi:hypothetical protein